FTTAPVNATTLTATVMSGGSPVTEGTVTFVDSTFGGTLCSNVALNGSGQATCSASFANEGNHTITANYSGSANFISSSANVVQTVNNHTAVSGNTFCNTGSLTLPDPAFPGGGG